MDSEQLAEIAADACDDRKAVDIQLIRVDEVSSLADWMVSASQVSPIMWSVMVVEGGLWRGFDLHAMLQPCGILLACGTACFVAGTVRFRRAL